MLIDSETTRIINNIGVAENAKLEGISVTARRILSAGENETIFDIISGSYKEFDEESKEENWFLGYFKKFGFTVSLPFTLLIGFTSKLGAEVRTLISIAREETNISKLVSAGFIKPEDVPSFMEKISKLEATDRIYSGEVIENGGISRWAIITKVWQ